MTSHGFYDQCTAIYMDHECFNSSEHHLMRAPSGRHVRKCIAQYVAGSVFASAAQRSARRKFG